MGEIERKRRIERVSVRERKREPGREKDGQMDGQTDVDRTG